MTIRYHIFILCASAFLSAGCSDGPVESGPTKSDSRIGYPRFRLNEGTEFEVAVNSDIAIYDKTGHATKKYKHKTRVRAKIVNGIALARSSRDRYGAVYSQKSPRPPAKHVGYSIATVEQEVPDSINFMPILGAAEGDLPTAIDNSSDSAGIVVHTEGYSAFSGQPVTNVKTYQNDTVRLTVKLTWAPVSGGFLLTEQRQKAYADDGSMAYIISTPDTTTMTISWEPAGVDVFLAALGKGVHRAACMALPSVAYAAVTAGTPVSPAHLASTGCGWSVAEFVWSTIGLGVASFSSLVAIGAILLYLGGWAFWTRSLYTMLQCFK